MPTTISSMSADKASPFRFILVNLKSRCLLRLIYLWNAILELIIYLKGCRNLSKLRGVWGIRFRNNKTIKVAEVEIIIINVKEKLTLSIHVQYFHIVCRLEIVPPESTIVFRSEVQAIVSLSETFPCQRVNGIFRKLQSLGRFWPASSFICLTTLDMYSEVKTYEISMLRRFELHTSHLLLYNLSLTPKRWITSFYCCSIEDFTSNDNEDSTTMTEGFGRTHSINLQDSRKFNDLKNDN